jgi:phage terminase small subunit
MAEKCEDSKVAESIEDRKKRIAAVLAEADSKTRIIEDNQSRPRETTLKAGQGETRETVAVSLHGKQSKNHAPRELTLKQRLFVDNYATPGSPTFSNRVQSALLAGYGNTYAHVNNTAGNMVQLPAVASAISNTFNKHKLTVEHRSGVLASLLHQCDTITVQENGEGEVTSRTRSSNWRAQIQAIKEINRMDGTYARAENVARAQRDVIHPVVSFYAKQLREALKAEAVGVGLQGGEIPHPTILDTVAGQEQAVGGIIEEGTDLQTEQDDVAT